MPLSLIKREPDHISNDSSPPHLRPLVLEKTCGSPTPPTTHNLLADVGERLDVQLEDSGAQTFVFDLTLRDGGSPRKDGNKSTVVGEHHVDDNHRPPSLHDSSLVDKNAASADYVSPTTDSSDSESIKAPVEPPGLLKLDADAGVKKDIEGIRIPAANGGDVECMAAANVSEPHEPPTTPTPEHLPYIFSIDPSVSVVERDLFSVSGLQSLHTFIPVGLLPDNLLVYDHDNITKRLPPMSKPQPDVPVRYVRIFPKARSRASADLYLKTGNSLGMGHHSAVYSAPLRLRLNPASAEQSTVRVAAKTVFAECGAHEMLAREAAAYNAFPRHLMEDRYPAESSATGAVDPEPATILTPDGAARPGTKASSAEATSTVSEDSNESKSSVPASWEGAGNARVRARLPSEPAVVPKFYGYYAAVNAHGRVIENSHKRLRCDEDSTCSVPEWPTRILLVEECGEPLDPSGRTHEQRTECLNLHKRLHEAGFVQGSVYARNIVVLPGPLSAPPEERSAEDTPSFRIIDFGRVHMRSRLSKASFVAGCEYDVEQAKRVLYLR